METSSTPEAAIHLNSANSQAPPPEREPLPKEGPVASGPDALIALTVQLGELSEYARCYIQAQLSTIQLSVRRFFLGILLFAVFLAAIIGAFLSAAVLTLLGISGGIASGLHTQPWVGHITTGVIFSLLMASIAYTLFQKQLFSKRRR